MSMSDCPKCWDTPCSCGDMYMEYTVDRNILILEAVTKALTAQGATLVDIYKYVESAVEEAQKRG